MPLPPWVVLDVDASKHKVNDYAASLTRTDAPMPEVPSTNCVMRAMDDHFSFYLRAGKPDRDAGATLAFPGAALDEARAPPPTAAARIAEELPKLEPGQAFVPIDLPPTAVQEMLQLKAPMFTVQKNHKPYLVTLLRVPNGVDGHAGSAPKLWPMSIVKKPESLPMPPDVAAAGNPGGNKGAGGKHSPSKRMRLQDMALGVAPQRTVQELEDNLAGVTRKSAVEYLEEVLHRKPTWLYKQLEKRDADGDRYEVTAALDGKEEGVGRGTLPVIASVC